MKSRGMTVAVAFLLALTATLAVFLYVRGIEKTRNGSGDTLEVIVSDRDIPVGTDLDGLLSEGAFSTQTVSEDSVVDGAVVDLSDLQGQETSAPILAGEQIPTARLRGVGVLPGGSLGIPAGHQAVSLPVQVARAAGGNVEGGDRIAIYASFDKGPNDRPVTVTLVPEVLVLDSAALGGEAGVTQQAGAEGLVVLALRPADATKVVYAQEQGRVWFGLLAPGEDGTKSAPVTILTVVQ